MKGKTLLILLLLAGCGGAGGSPGKGEEVYERPLGTQYRSEIATDLGLDPLNLPPDEELAAIALQYVHSTNVAPPGWPLLDPRFDAGTVDDVTWNVDYWPQYGQWKRGEKQYKCGGLSYLYAWIMESLGVPARQLSLVSQEYFTGEVYWSHETVEVYLDGRWVVRDPTFNAAFQCSGGENASIEELTACRDAITWTYGASVKPDQMLEAYPKPFSDHLHARHYFNSNLKPEPVPAEWWITTP